MLHQTILEGLISDVLCEHFGDAVEVVGITLLRNGEMTFPELIRAIGKKFLALPFESTNSFLSKFFLNANVNNRTLIGLVRDALLVLIHYGLVRVTVDKSEQNTTYKYSLSGFEVVRRLSLTYYLSLVDTVAADSLRQVVKRGRVRLDALNAEHAENLLTGLKFLKTVDSIDVGEVGPVGDGLASSSRTKATQSSQSSPSLIVAPNTAELELAFLKKKILLSLFPATDSPGHVIVSELLSAVTLVSSSFAGSLSRSTSLKDLSVGTLSVFDLQKSTGLTQQQLVGELIKLNAKNFVKKRAGLGPTGPMVLSTTSVGAPKKRARRAPNTKQLLATDDVVESNDFFKDLTSAGGTTSLTNQSAVPAYCVNMGELVHHLQLDVLTAFIKSKYGQSGNRVFQLLLAGQKLEPSHVAEICAISREDALRFLHVFNMDGICSVTEVPKVASSGTGASAAAAFTTGGLTAVMRAVASSFWLYGTDFNRARASVLAILIKSIINLRRRFRLEVVRQCKIEERATELSEAQEKYLSRVHEAQDILESNSITLVNSLVVLSFGAT